LHRVFVGDVNGGEGVRIAQFGGSTMCAVGVEVGHGDPVTLGGQALRGCPADPGRAADDDGHPPVAHPVAPSTVK
jgi:hypothetical protein